MKGDAMIRFALIIPFIFALSACNTYPAPPHEDPPIDPPQIPYACKAEFAMNFDQPLQVADTVIRYAGFSPDCSKMYTVDEAVQKLRVIDLETREVTELSSNIYLAWFARDSKRVFYLLPIADTYEYELYIADGDQVHLIDSQTSTTILQSPDGKSIAYLKNYNTETYQSDLYLANIEKMPPEVVKVAGPVMGTLTFTPDGRLIYQDDSVHHHIEQDNLWCDWHTTSLRAFSPADSKVELLGEDVLSWSFRVSKDGQRIYGAADYNCEAQTQSLVAYSLTGQAPIRLLAGQPMFLGPHEMLELPESGEILHSMYIWGQNPEDLRSELWATRVDGSGYEILAENVMSQMQTCMYFIPFQVAYDQVLLYLQRETHELMAFDRVAGKSWEILDGSQGLWYQLSPDGQSLLSYSDEYSPAELRLTEVVGGETRTLMTGLMPGHESAWARDGERILLLPADIPGSGHKKLYSINPETGESIVVADDVPGEWLYGNTFVMHPSSHLVAVQRTGGMFLSRIP
jgi:hypothetical protein